MVKPPSSPSEAAPLGVPNQQLLNQLYLSSYAPSSAPVVSGAILPPSSSLGAPPAAGPDEAHLSVGPDAYPEAGLQQHAPGGPHQQQEGRQPESQQREQGSHLSGSYPQGSYLPGSHQQGSYHSHHQQLVDQMYFNSYAAAAGGGGGAGPGNNRQYSDGGHQYNEMSPVNQRYSDEGHQQYNEGAPDSPSLFDQMYELACETPVGLRQQHHDPQQQQQQQTSGTGGGDLGAEHEGSFEDLMASFLGGGTPSELPPPLGAPGENLVNQLYLNSYVPAVASAAPSGYGGFFGGNGSDGGVNGGGGGGSGTAAPPGGGHQHQHQPLHHHHHHHPALLDELYFNSYAANGGGSAAAAAGSGGGGVAPLAGRGGGEGWTSGIQADSAPAMMTRSAGVGPGSYYPQYHQVPWPRSETLSGFPATAATGTGAFSLLGDESLGAALNQGALSLGAHSQGAALSQDAGYQGSAGAQTLQAGTSLSSPAAVTAAEAARALQSSGAFGDHHELMSISSLAAMFED